MPPGADQIASWMRDQLSETSARGFVVGLSGGIDSAVVARLAQLAAGDAAVTAVLMPCHGDPKDEQDARLVADQFKLRTVRIDLGPPYDALVSALRTAAAGLGPELTSDGTHDDIRARLPLANVKPRLRMATLYFVANTQNYLVAGTGNRSELAIGYFTKYGDGGVDLLPIGRLLKDDVRALARELGVPPAIIDKAPSAGLWIGQTDEGEMGFSYAELGQYLTSGAQSVAAPVAARIDRLVKASEHKRSAVPMPDF
jgi:NAD+ synthase